MIACFKQEGKSIDYRPSEAVAAGDVVVQGNLVGIARLDIAANTLGSLAVVGVFDVEKATGAVTAGAVVYWDAANHKATATATGNQYLGKAVLDAESADELVRVLLNAPFVAIVGA